MMKQDRLALTNLKPMFSVSSNYAGLMSCEAHFSGRFIKKIHGFNCMDIYFKTHEVCPLSSVVSDANPSLYLALIHQYYMIGDLYPL